MRKPQPRFRVNDPLTARASAFHGGKGLQFPIIKGVPEQVAAHSLTETCPNWLAEGTTRNQMKKKIFSFLMLVLMGCMCTTFTACGGDDDDDVPKEDLPSTATYFEPCFDWGSTTDHVKAYMSGWDLAEESNDYAQMYTNHKNTTTVVYTFLGRNQGLSMLTVTYITGNAQYIISEIEKRYNMTLTKDDESSKKGDTVYSGTGTIGGRTIAVLLHSTSATVTVIFGIPD